MRVFDTIRPPPALLQVRYRDLTNVRQPCAHCAHNSPFKGAKKDKSHIISVKKSLAERGLEPKTELDRQFLLLAERSMRARGIATDRAMSMALDKHPDFIGRVRKGIQSATADAWETLRTKFPVTPDSTTTNVTTHGGGQAVGTIHGDNVYAPTTLEACQQELEVHKRDLASVRADLEKAQQQVASQERLIASLEKSAAHQEEIISLLRGGFNRPN